MSPSEEIATAPPQIALLDGVKVVEVATWMFVPTAAAVLAEWGASVVKIEDPRRGDALRGTTAWGVGPEQGNGTCPFFHLANRGKRSIGVDLKTGPGREVLRQLVETADVFLTNIRPRAREALGIDVEDVAAWNADVIYGCGSGQGPLGPDHENAGFDFVSYWARSGASSGAQPSGHQGPIPMPGPGFGDAQAGLNLAGGIVAALFHRQKTGRAVVVDASLLSAGMWGMQSSFAGAGILGSSELEKIDWGRPANPLVNHYGTSDGRFVALAMPESDRYWGVLCKQIGRADLAADERFLSAEARATYSHAAAAELEATFRLRTLAEWVAVLDEQDGAWSVVQTVGELLSDPQVDANSYFGTVDQGDGTEVAIVRAPVTFDRQPTPLHPSPELGAHTEEVLLELGYDWTEISDLKTSGDIT